MSDSIASSQAAAPPSSGTASTLRSIQLFGGPVATIISPFVIIYAAAVIIGSYARGQYLDAFNSRWVENSRSFESLSLWSMKYMTGITMAMMGIIVCSLIGYVIGGISSPKRPLFGVYEKFFRTLVPVIGMWCIASLFADKLSDTGYPAKGTVVVFIFVGLQFGIFFSVAAFANQILRRTSFRHRSTLVIGIFFASVMTISGPGISSWSTYIVPAVIRADVYRDVYSVISPNTPGVVLEYSGSDGLPYGRKLGVVATTPDYLVLASKTGDVNSTTVYWILTENLPVMHRETRSCAEVEC